MRGNNAGGLSVANQLGLILDGYDRPFSRLAAAIKLVLTTRDMLPSARAAAVNSFRASLIGEWMRGLGGLDGEADALMLASRLEGRLAGSAVGDVDLLALDVAAELLRTAELQVLGHDAGAADRGFGP
ncbi:MAG TPA: hypothetical protein VIY52_22445 [Streptosporangiaceae bacterium]